MSFVFPKIMGIVNVTPDSFSDGGLFLSVKEAVEQSLILIDDGADIIDIGGESTRPGANEVSEEDEFNRVIPLIEKLNKLRPEIIISIDTTKSNVAKAACDYGATIINDIGGLSINQDLANIAREYNASLILMHIQGKPRTMQQNPSYEDVTQEVFDYLKEKIELAKQFEVKNVIADVGIGFGKTLEHNLDLLKNHIKFKELDVPLCLGISRKSFIGKLLNIENPKERDIPTALIHALLLNAGADIIRVHNVKNITLLKYLTKYFI